MGGPPQLREGPSSLWARAHRAGQAVCQRAPPRTSHCHTACTPPCPIIAIIRLRPGRPFPWPSALHNGERIMQTGASLPSPQAAAATTYQTSSTGRASSRLTPASGPAGRNDSHRFRVALLSPRLRRCAPALSRRQVWCSSASAAGDRGAGPSAATPSRGRKHPPIRQGARTTTAASCRASLPGKRWRGGSPASRLPYGGASAGLDPDERTARRIHQGAMLRKSP